MEKYRIVCVTTERPHRHITLVGVGEKPDEPPDERFTVTEVRDMLDNGDVFYTVSPKNGKEAEVRKSTCKKGKCKVKTIRSKNDAVKDNNLDRLKACP
jgi:hypothetical protein